jgi:hypothetical protein
MKSLHLLIHGNSIEEVKSNLDKAWADFKSLHGRMSEPNCIAYGEYEYDMVEAPSMSNIYRGTITFPRKI